jgi:hypothetical protein
MIETKNIRVAPIVVSQAILSAGAYLIEHPDATRSDYSLAGLEGALRAYGNAVATDSKLRDKFLDSLVAAEREGKLRQRYLDKVVEKCEQSARRGAVR